MSCNAHEQDLIPRLKSTSVTHSINEYYGRGLKSVVISLAGTSNILFVENVLLAAQLSDGRTAQK